MADDRNISFRGYDPYEEVRIMRRRLPHWRQSGVAYFVTFRLADSLPQSLLRQWRDERATWERWHPTPWSAAEEREYEERFVHRIQEWLDAGMGACHLRRPEVRAQVELCLLHFEGKRYDVDAFVLMPNHVHAVIVPRIGYELSTLYKGSRAQVRIAVTSCSATNQFFGWMNHTTTSFAMPTNWRPFVVTLATTLEKPV